LKISKVNGKIILYGFTFYFDTVGLPLIEFVPGILFESYEK